MTPQDAQVLIDFFDQGPDAAEYNLQILGGSQAIAQVKNPDSAKYTEEELIKAAIIAAAAGLLNSYLRVDGDGGGAEADAEFIGALSTLTGLWRQELLKAANSTLTPIK